MIVTGATTRTKHTAHPSKQDLTDVIRKNSNSKSHVFNNYLLKKHKKLLKILNCSTKDCAYCNKGEGGMSLLDKSGDILKRKYLTSIESYNAKTISDIIYNENCHIVSVFKDFLIYDDISEFLKRFYYLEESKGRLPKVLDFYHKYSKVFPNYIVLKESKYMFKNIERKQRVIDENQKRNMKGKKKQGRKESEEKDDAKIFNTNFIKEIKDQEKKIIQKAEEAEKKRINEMPVDKLGLADLVDRFIDNDSMMVDPNAPKEIEHPSFSILYGKKGEKDSYPNLMCGSTKNSRSNEIQELINFKGSQTARSSNKNVMNFGTKNKQPLYPKNIVTSTKNKAVGSKGFYYNMGVKKNKHTKELQVRGSPELKKDILLEVEKRLGGLKNSRNPYSINTKKNTKELKFTSDQRPIHSKKLLLPEQIKMQNESKNTQSNRFLSTEIPISHQFNRIEPSTTKNEHKYENIIRKQMKSKETKELSNNNYQRQPLNIQSGTLLDTQKKIISMKYQGMHKKQNSAVPLGYLNKKNNFEGIKYVQPLIVNKDDKKSLQQYFDGRKSEFSEVNSLKPSEKGNLKKMGFDKVETKNRINELNADNQMKKIKLGKLVPIQENKAFQPKTDTQTPVKQPLKQNFFETNNDKCSSRKMSTARNSISNPSSLVSSSSNTPVINPIPTTKEHIKCKKFLDSKNVPETQLMNKQKEKLISMIPNYSDKSKNTVQPNQGAIETKEKSKLNYSKSMGTLNKMNKKTKANIIRNCPTRESPLIRSINSTIQVKKRITPEINSLNSNYYPHSNQNINGKYITSPANFKNGIQKKYEINSKHLNYEFKSSKIVPISTKNNQNRKGARQFTDRVNINANKLKPSQGKKLLQKK